jgi:hypothetical protein
VTSKRESAIQLAKQGHRVFPLVMNGKTPALDSNWRKVATSDPAKVHDMWTCPVMDAEQDYNIGIALPADTFVFDEDSRDGKEGAKSRELLEVIYEPLAPTFTVRTPSGGTHRYYRTPRPVGNSSSKLAKHIDIKSEGGFVVAPGSTIDGKPYEVIVAGYPANAPEWLLTLAGQPRERAATVDTSPLTELDSAAAIARATEWLQTKAPEAGTYAVAARVKDFGISQERATELLLDHWPPAESKGEEHVAFRVANAYRYGQNAPGISSAEAEFDAVEIDPPKTVKRRGVYFQMWQDIRPNFDQPYLIDGVIDQGTMVVTYGDSNTGKTYVKVDQAFHIAAGRDWNGHKVKQGAVVYIAAEGGGGFGKRVAAFKKKYGLEDLPFAVVPCAVDMFSEHGDTGKLVKLVREVEERTGQKVVLIVVDTLARAMAGGDESTSVDMGKFIANCDRLRQACGATVNIIHHTGKDRSKGARGSSALRAATDTEIEIGVGTLAVTKQRDMAKGAEMRFELEALEIGHRADGKAVTACVVRWLAENEFVDQLTPQAEKMFEVLEGLIAARRDEIDEAEGDGEGDKSDIRIPWAEWQMSLLSELKGPRGKPMSRTVLFRHRLELSQTGRVKKDHSNQWYI